MPSLQLLIKENNPNPCLISEILINLINSSQQWILVHLRRSSVHASHMLTHTPCGDSKVFKIGNIKRTRRHQLRDVILGFYSEHRSFLIYISLFLPSQAGLDLSNMAATLTHDPAANVSVFLYLWDTPPSNEWHFNERVCLICISAGTSRLYRWPLWVWCRCTVLFQCTKKWTYSRNTFKKYIQGWPTGANVPQTQK